MYFLGAHGQGRKRWAREALVWPYPEVTGGHSGLGGDVQIERMEKQGAFSVHLLQEFKASYSCRV